MRELAPADDALPAPEVHAHSETLRAEAPEGSGASLERREVALGAEKVKTKRKIIRESMRWGSEFEPDSMTQVCDRYKHLSVLESL